MKFLNFNLEHLIKNKLTKESPEVKTNVKIF